MRTSAKAAFEKRLRAARREVQIVDEKKVNRAYEKLKRMEATLEGLGTNEWHALKEKVRNDHWVFPFTKMFWR